MVQKGVQLGRSESLRWMDLLVDPLVSAALEGHQLLGLEPQADLFIGAVHRVAAVDDVPEETQQG